MAVSLYFGLPGAGKTTIMAAIAYKVLKAKRPRYRHILSNVDFGSMKPFDKVTVINASDLGKYEGFEDSLILIDEASLEWDSREYKNFAKEKVQFFLLHRHWNCDICLFTQQWDAVDKKIRVITDRVYYVYKGNIFGHWISKYYRIPYGIIIPDPNKKQSGEKLGDIVQGYCKPNIFQRIFCHRVYRPRYYKYFDSWERPKLRPCPYEIKEIREAKQRKSTSLFPLSDKNKKSMKKSKVRSIKGEEEKSKQKMQ